MKNFLIFLAWFSTSMATAEVHPGPAGLKWMKSPATARSVYASKFTFVSEKEAEKNGYHVVHQVYKGRFGNLPAAMIEAFFFQGEFYQLKITLAPVTRASKLFEVAVDKMSQTYGPPITLTRPKKLYSGRANLEYAYLEDDAKQRMTHYRDEVEDKVGGKFAILDSQMVQGLYFPKAEWFFSNGIEVEIVSDVILNEKRDGVRGFLTTWTFSHKEHAKKAKAVALFPARDY